MRLELKKIKAKNCPVDVFVYLPYYNRFIYVDNVDVLENTTVIYSEIQVKSKGIDETTVQFKNNSTIYYYES